MAYKPKYCCQCGEKVERINWQPWTNRRFCQLCETDFGIYDWIPTIILTLGLFLSIFSFGNLWRKPEKPLIVSANSQNSNKNSSPQSDKLQNSDPATVQSSAAPKNENITAAQVKQSAAAFKPTDNVKESTNQSHLPIATEVVYFCGAQTKKGTPCTRRVKNAVRCWQHNGQPALLPPEKLISGQ